ncbi:hypothetical protein [Methylocystis bryophila]|uniref:Uncharacterized protein n=1 Tax=Methylocystis bryophila TaxID=655015 RepID=A0A1W6MWJ4_9HYPH|nr:hypothetical protein [Methylocystis bryophila]ARN81957.1 hypothetical protein B1812_13665 [Methylocystis bryophila]BDV38052.1 hypothetical protein DSM21852_13050 [Methylocystis bryophila]
MKSWALAIASTIFVLHAASASARPARCVIVSNGEKEFNGPCDYMAESGGSFSVSRAKGHKFLEIDPISVTIVSPGVAEVRGLTKLGNNSRWGEAKRSTADPACWVGSDFKICVY